MERINSVSSDGSFLINATPREVGMSIARSSFREKCNSNCEGERQICSWEIASDNRFVTWSAGEELEQFGRGCGMETCPQHFNQMTRACYWCQDRQRQAKDLLTAKEKQFHCYLVALVWSAAVILLCVIIGICVHRLHT